MLTGVSLRFFNLKRRRNPGWYRKPEVLFLSHPLCPPKDLLPGYPEPEEAGSLCHQERPDAPVVARRPAAAGFDCVVTRSGFQIRCVNHFPVREVFNDRIPGFHVVQLEIGAGG